MDLKQCTMIKGDIDFLKRWTRSIRLGSIPGNVFKNLKSILGSVSELISARQAKDYFQTGKVVADILFTVLGGPTSELAQMMEQFIPTDFSQAVPVAHKVPEARVMPALVF